MRKTAMMIMAFVLFGSLMQAGVQDGGTFKKVDKRPMEKGTLSKMLGQSDLQEMSQRLQQWMTDRSRSRSGNGHLRNQGSTISPGSSQLNLGDTKIWKDEKTGLPFFVSGRWSPAESSSMKKASAEERVFGFLREKKSLLMLQYPGEEFRVRQVLTDHILETHVRLQQTYKGLDVFGKDIVVHVTNDGSILGFNGRYSPTPVDLIDVIERIPSEDAIHRVKVDLNVQVAKIDECGKKVYIRESGKAVLVWHVIIRSGNQRWYYFVDAKTGDIVHRIDYTMTDGPTTGTGIDLFGRQQTVQLYQKGADYYMIDASKPMFDAARSDPPDNVTGGIVIFDIKNEMPSENTQLYYVGSTDKNTWPANAVSLETGVSRVYDFYNTVFGRNSIDGKGMTIYAIVNVGQGYNNAYWNGFALWFGNGDGNRYSDICGAFDVIGHEFTHGVTQHTSNLIYENQSGALNESMSDIFGALAEYHYEGDNGDWLIGEDVYTPAISGDALRDMEFPSGPKVENKLPATMSEYVVLPNTEEGDWGGVHVNCSIVARAAVLIAQNIGRDKMGGIFYRAQTTHLTQSSQLIDARLACVKSAQDLYGAGGAEEQAVKNAFDTVEIFGGNPTPPPPDYSPVEGDEWILVVDAQTGLLHRCKTVITDNSDIEQLTATPVSNRPSVSDDGSLILFVDGNNDLVGINSDGTGETNITQGSTYQGLIGSVALSPNAQYLAFTSVFSDATIYLMDIVAGTITNLPLYSPVTWQGAEPVYDVQYADAMDWDFDSAYLLYDCYHQSPTILGGSIGYWSINLIRVQDGTIFNVFGSQPVGVSVGNPVFASTNDYIFAYDHMDVLNNTSVLAANMETGEEGIIQADNFGQLGYPTYNPRDNTVAFHTLATDGVSTFDGIAQKQLRTDKVTGEAGTEFVYLNYAVLPVWFAIGNRADIEVVDTQIPTSPELGENYPNPFNPETTIPFQISEKSHTRLTVYNMLGEPVAELVNDTFLPGRYKVRWHGVDGDGRWVPSGVYLYRLEIGERLFSHKMVLMR